MFTPVAISVFAVIGILGCVVIYCTRQMIVSIDKYKADNSDWFDRYHNDDRSYRSRQ